MGSGLFLAAVVLAWFIVLVPMVLTRRDTAVESVIRDNDTSSARVLRRTTKAAGPQRRSLSMSARESSPSHHFDDTVDTAIHERIVDAEPEYEEPHEVRERGPRRTDSARQRIIQRRRQTLIGLGASLLLTLALAFFAGSWTWSLAAASGTATLAYVVHLRNETRREEERRLTRAIRADRARPDVLDRHAARSQSSLAANAFVAAGPVSVPEPVLLDDEDPELFDIGEAPVSYAVDLSGRRHYSEYQDSPDYYDWDDDYDTSLTAGHSDVEYTDGDYGIDGPQSETDGRFRSAV